VEGVEYLAGAAEIAEELGVDANTINQWKARYPDFPEPLRILKAGHVWDLREVLAWARSTGRMPTESKPDDRVHDT
jgi:hypothetical protein